MYYGFYINLEKDKVKRDAIEYILSSNYIHSYKRFKAIDSETNLGPTMSLKGAEKGCFLSHYSILKSNINSNSIIHIVEDDAVFNHKIIKSANLISTIDDTQWDIIFTDVFVQPNPSFFCDLKDILDEFKGINVMASNSVWSDEILLENLPTSEFVLFHENKSVKKYVFVRIELI